MGKKALHFFPTIVFVITAIVPESGEKIVLQLQHGAKKVIEKKFQHEITLNTVGLLYLQCKK